MLVRTDYSVPFLQKPPLLNGTKSVANIRPPYLKWLLFTSCDLISTARSRFP